MELEECLRWTVRHHALDSRTADAGEIRDILKKLAASAAGRDLPTNHFQACLNSRDLFTVVKLVHVAENAEPGDEKSGWGLVPGRRRAVLDVLRGLNERRRTRFDVERLDAVYSAIIAAGAGGWFPVFGFEFKPATGEFPEVSLYGVHRPSSAAAAAAPVVGVKDLARVRAALPKVFALGLDVLADGGMRFKMYLDAPADEALALVGLLDPMIRPARVLLLSRTRPDGGFEPGTKAYAPLPAKSPDRPTACTMEELAQLAKGPLAAFAKKILPAARGQSVYYVGSSAEKTEFYFGRGKVPAARTPAARAGSRRR